MSADVIAPPSRLSLALEGLGLLDLIALLPAFPLLMTADVVATGNHYVLDVVGSVVLVAASVAVASRRRARLAPFP